MKLHAQRLKANSREIRMFGVKSLQGRQQYALEAQPVRRRHYQRGGGYRQFDRIAAIHQCRDILGGKRAVARESREVDIKRWTFEKRRECSFGVNERMRCKLGKPLGCAAFACGSTEIEEFSAADRTLSRRIA
jgi:hypothetical protein